jgi:NAD(P)-dependent dehydrogenase (short-subunit alcohol dehydrogenase family)
MMLPLKGKIAIITGANQGLGLEISRQYIKAGASLVMCARNIDLLQKAKAKLTHNLTPGQVIEVVSVDVSNANRVEQLANFAIQRFEKIDILVNNAGIYGPMGTIEMIDWAEWVKAIEINLFGSILMC